MTIALVIAVFVLGGLGGAVAAKTRWRARPVNVVGGVLLPEPRDGRWVRLDCQSYSYGPACSGGWKLGTVEVCEKHGLYVGKFQLPDRKLTFTRAVLTAQAERLALNAIAGEDVARAR